MQELGDVILQCAMARDEYVKRGYDYPVHGVEIITDMYKQLASVDDSEDRTRDLKTLQIYTITKLFNSAITTFDVRTDGELRFSFVNGVPTKETADFFNLKDENGEYLDLETTSTLRLPNNMLYNLGASTLCNYALRKDGEEISIQNMAKADEAKQ